MSTLKVTNIESPSGGGVSAKINDIGGGQLSNRNLIINGAMQVAQRGTSGNSGGYQTVDRWDVQLSGGTFTQSQETLATTDLPFTQDGHRNSIKIANDTNTTAAGSFRNFVTTLEAQDIAKCGWDYTSASSFVTLSFWVKSSVSQEFYASFRTHDGTQQNYVFAFTPAAGIWTKVTKTIPGNASLQFDLDAAQGLSVNIAAWWGTTYTSPAVTTDTWQAWSGGLRFPDMTDTWANTLDSTFELTGVQLEVGNLATSFEHRSYGDEELRCMRYYQRFGEALPSVAGTDDGFMTFANYTGTNAYGGQKFTVPMRGRPTMVASGCAYYSNGSTDNSITVDMIGASTNYGELRVSGFSFTGGDAGWLRIEAAGAYIEFNAEL